MPKSTPFVGSGSAPRWPQLSWDQAALAASLSQHPARCKVNCWGMARLLDPKQNLAA